MLEKTHHQHPFIAAEDVFSAVAVVHVKVHNGHALQAVALHRVLGGHGHVVEKAKPHGSVALRMVAGRAHAAKGAGRFARQHQVGGHHRGAGRAQGCRDRERVHVGVGIDLVVALGRRGGHEFADIARGMRMGQLFQRGQRRIVGMHVVEQALDQQHVVDGAQAFRAFGMVGAHFVAGAIGVGDVGRQQNLSP